MWEYKVINLSGVHDPQKHNELLNQWGAYGWELVAVYGHSGGYMFYLKRKR